MGLGLGWGWGWGAALSTCLTGAAEQRIWGAAQPAAAAWSIASRSFQLRALPCEMSTSEPRRWSGSSCSSHTSWWYRLPGRVKLGITTLTGCLVRGRYAKGE